MNAKNILLTGPPRCGKSTLIEKVVNRIDRPLTGFYTREIREKGTRTGFSIVTLDGRDGILAHVKLKSPVRVGKYRVNLHDLDQIAVPSMMPSNPDEVVVIDEIGKMECCSELFRETLVRTLDAPQRVIGTIALRGGAFIRSIKSREDVQISLVSKDNSSELEKSLVDALQ
jgi:nucleoside-triphosphatase